MDVSTPETPAAPAAEPSLEQIIGEELKAADAAGTPVVQETKASTETPPVGDAPAEDKTPVETPTTETAPAEEPVATEEKPDDVSAARARRILAEAHKRQADLDEREANMGRTLLEQLFKSPKATLAKFGKSVDDLIDSSIAEGKDPAPPEAKVDDNPRLTALEKRVADREAAEQRAREQQAIDTRKQEIHREINAAATKYPAVVAAGRASDVTDYMVEYHSIHGKPISWDRAAAAVERDLTGLGIAVAKKLGWAAPAAKTTPAAEAPKERPGTTSIGGEQRSSAPTTGEEPEDPEKLMLYLAKQFGVA